MMESHRPALVCAGPHVPVAIGAHAGIRCLHCNVPVEPDPRVTATAERPWSPNTDATAAAVNARGSRCGRCGHWTYRRSVEPKQGRPSAVELCGNCISTGDGETAVVRITGTPLPPKSEFHRYDGDFGLCTCGRSMGDIRHRPEDLSERLAWKHATLGEHYGICRDPSADAQAATWEGRS